MGKSKTLIKPHINHADRGPPKAAKIHIQHLQCSFNILHATCSPSAPAARRDPRRPRGCAGGVGGGGGRHRSRPAPPLPQTTRIPFFGPNYNSHTHFQNFFRLRAGRNLAAWLFIVGGKPPRCCCETLLPVETRSFSFVFSCVVYYPLEWFILTMVFFWWVHLTSFVISFFFDGRDRGWVGGMLSRISLRSGEAVASIQAAEDELSRALSLRGGNSDLKRRRNIFRALQRFSKRLAVVRFFMLWNDHFFLEWWC